MFTFPSLSFDLDFEYELADQLFANGKVLIHSFPVQPTIPKSMIASRTSSISSNGSLMSSRTNSSNSSARTSASEGSSRRTLSTVDQSRYVAVKASNNSSRIPYKECQTRNYCNSSYGRSQRWQFISPVPAFNRRNSSSKRKGRKVKREAGIRKGICRRFFQWLVSTCQECHAIEPSKRPKVSMGLQ